jgi:hypothetical protein
MTDKTSLVNEIANDAGTLRASTSTSVGDGEIASTVQEKGVGLDMDTGSLLAGWMQERADIRQWLPEPDSGKCEFPICAVHHICTRNCERNAGEREEALWHAQCPDCMARLRIALEASTKRLSVELLEHRA